MKQLTISVCLASTLAAAPLMAADANNPEAQPADYRAQWHSDILTGYQNLEAQSQTLAAQAETYCKTPSSEGFEQTQRAWRDAFLAWQRVRFVNFGPVKRGNLDWQFQFWPDSKNLVARKAKFLLKGNTAITPETITESGVAVQGFPMAEYLLYDQDFNKSDKALPAEHACQLLIRVTDHIANNGETVANAWGDFQKNYVENDQYTDLTIRAAMAGIELLEERRLAQPMGLRGTGKRSVYSADAWRSGASLIAADATIQGLQQQFMPAFSRLLKDHEQADLARRIAEQLDEAHAKFPELDRPMGPLLTNDEEFRAMQSLYVHVSQANVLLSDQAAAALGIVRGFNSTDGD